MRIALFLVIITAFLTAFSVHAEYVEDCSYFLTKRLSLEDKEKLATLRKQMRELKKNGTIEERVAVAAKALELRNVDFRISKDGKQISIVPSNRSALNTYAKNLYTRLNKTKLKYDPRETTDSHGVFSVNTASVYMDESFIAIPRRSGTLQHEVEHAVVHSNARDGKVSLFYGDIVALEDEVKISQSEMYSDYLALDEAIAELLSLRADLTIEALKFATLRREVLGYTKKALKNSLQNSEARIENTTRILNILETNPEKITYRKEKIAANYGATYDAVVVSIKDNGSLTSLPFSDELPLLLLKKDKSFSKSYFLNRTKAQMQIMKKLSQDMIPYIEEYKKIIDLATRERRNLTSEEYEELMAIASKAISTGRKANREYIEFVINLDAKYL